MAKKIYMVRICRNNLDKAVKYAWVLAGYVFTAFAIFLFDFIVEAEGVNYPNVDYVTDALFVWVVISAPYALVRFIQAINAIKKVLIALADVVER